MSDSTIPQSSPFAMLAGWLKQGTDSFFASQRILMDLVMRQNARTIGAFQERLVEARELASNAATELAGEGISNFIAAQRVLLNLAQRENEILTTAVKERVPAPVPVAAVADLFSRGVETVIGMQQHLLTIAARQADGWIDATKSGEPFEGLQLTALARESMETFVRSQKKFLDALAEETARATGEPNGKTHPARKTELAELARQSAEAYVDAQKKLLDLATQQLKMNLKTARETINAINLMPVETVGEIAQHTVHGLLEAQNDFFAAIVKPKQKMQAREETAAPKKPLKKRAASARSKASAAAAASA
jgi:hypothetical protein